MKISDLESRAAEDLLEGLLSTEANVGVDEIDGRATMGSSVRARDLVNTREALAELAAAESERAEGSTPSAALRARVLASTGLVQGSDRLRAGTPEDEPDPRSLVPDSSERVAEIQIENEAAGRDRARLDEVEALGAHESDADDRFDRVLAELSALMPYRVFLIAVLHGEWVHHRATRGLPEALGDFRKVARTGTFCTHCVSSEDVFRVENAALEPFFRGNRMVWKFGARAYAGAPLRTSRDVVYGTVCALHDQPRSVPPIHLELLSHYAKRVGAEIERKREPGLLAEIVQPEGAAASGGEPKEIVTEAWFRRLLELVLALGESEGDVDVRAFLEVTGDERLATAAAGAVVARLNGDGPNIFAILTTHESSLGQDTAASPGAVSCDGQPGADEWLDAARKRSV